MKKTTFIFLIMLMSLGFSHVQDTNAKYQGVDEMDDWGFVITPYALLASQALCCKTTGRWLVCK